MKPPSKLKGHAGADPEVMDIVNSTEQIKVQVPEGESDSEYENVPKKPKSDKTAKTVSAEQAEVSVQSEAMHVDGPTAKNPDGAEDAQEDGNEATQLKTALTDDDWLRSRTSRLLGINDDDDDDAQTAPAPSTSLQPVHEDKADADFEGFDDDAKDAPAPVVVEEDADTPDVPPGNEVEDKIRQSQRLYLRNLSYKIVEEDLRGAFDGFGNLDEVSHSLFFITQITQISRYMMNI